MTSVSTCYVSCPSLSTVVTITPTSGTPVPVGAHLAYKSDHTNYFGFTGCNVYSNVKVTPSNSQTPYTTQRCTFPTAVSGTPYSITPVIYVPRPSPTNIEHYTGDPIAASVLNAGNFKFVFSKLPGKDLGEDRHDFHWNTPRYGGIPMGTKTLWMMRPSSTPFYVVNLTKATTTFIPTTRTSTKITTSTTTTLAQKTSVVSVTNGTVTSTCTSTVTVTVSGSAAGKSARDVNLTTNEPAPSEATAAEPTPSDLIATDATVAELHDPNKHAPFDEYELPKFSFADPNTNYTEMELKQREEEVVQPEYKHRFKARAPTIGRPDFIYPPYGASTVFVSSIFTSTSTISVVSSFTITPNPPTITTTKIVTYTSVPIVTTTVTVTK